MKGKGFCKNTVFILMALIVPVFIMLGLSACEGGDDDVKLGRGLFTGSGKTVGKNIGIDDIREFYYTVENINYDAYYQRYRFYVEDGKYFFFHETRERKGDYGPCTEDDTTAKGTLELTFDQWEEFYDLILDGTVKEREDDGSAGDSGPWYYLYWKGDKDKYQEFSFASDTKEVQFEQFCTDLRSMTYVKPDLDGEPEIELIRFSYSPGYGDMNGAAHYRELRKNKKDEWEFESRDCESFEEPMVTTIYAVSGEELKKLELFIQQVDIEALSKRKESDDFWTDYSSWNFNIKYKDLNTGETFEYRLEQYRDYTDNDYKIINDLEELFDALRGEVLSETTEDD